MKFISMKRNQLGELFAYSDDMAVYSIGEADYPSRVEAISQKNRNGEELSDDELDILFEQMSTECADSMNGTHPPTDRNE